MNSDYYLNKRNENFKTMMGALGVNRLVLLTGLPDGFDDSTAWADILPFRASFPGYRDVTLSMDEMGGPVKIDGKWCSYTAPATFMQTGDGDGPVTCPFFAWVVRVGPTGSWVDHWVSILPILPDPIVFENDRDTKSITFRMFENQCGDPITVEPKFILTEHEDVLLASPEDALVWSH